MKEGKDIAMLISTHILLIPDGIEVVPWLVGNSIIDSCRPYLSTLLSKSIDSTLVTERINYVVANYDLTSSNPI